MIENYSTKKSSNIISNLLNKKGKEKGILNQKVNNLYNQLLMFINSGMKEKFDSNIFLEALNPLFISNNFIDYS